MPAGSKGELKHIISQQNRMKYTRGVLPIMAYTGRLRPKGVPFSGFKYIKGLGFHKFRYLKGPLIVTFRIDASYGCISSFTEHYMKTRTRLPKIGV